MKTLYPAISTGYANAGTLVDSETAEKVRGLFEAKHGEPLDGDARIVWYGDAPTATEAP